MGTKNITIKTAVNEKFRFLARDLDGSVFAFVDKPSIATDIACDTWDVKTGEILQITPSIPEMEDSENLTDWRESLIEIDDEVICN
ncbi:MAG: hypothetical protein QGH83_01200 [Candidatus Pacebacteria bacterium]|jgi:hypothetical protein|nr:hypothetical protein [Candidatus Paceibacterota bacterium]|tara:strand:- start:46 stop:303 length:258 start_codon:yes stop_codon:yes gene_type:complete